MKVPVRIMIGGCAVRISYVESLPDDDGSELSGDSNALTRAIRINLNQHKTSASLLATILHEIFHMALGLTGHSEVLGDRREEAVVLGLETMLAPLLLLNPAAPVRWREVVMPWED